MKQRKTVRVAGPFSVEALIETYPDNPSKVLGYNIRGLGSAPRRSSRLNWKIDGREFKAVFADIEGDMAQQRARLAARPKDAPLELSANTRH